MKEYYCNFCSNTTEVMKMYFNWNWNQQAMSYKFFIRKATLKKLILNFQQVTKSILLYYNNSHYLNKLKILIPSLKCTHSRKTYFTTC